MSTVEKTLYTQADRQHLRWMSWSCLTYTGTQLRIEPVDTGRRILTMNVTSDGRIDTFDALSIMKKYISDKEFAIILK